MCIDYSLGDNMIKHTLWNFILKEDNFWHKQKKNKIENLCKYKYKTMGTSIELMLDLIQKFAENNNLINRLKIFPKV